MTCTLTIDLACAEGALQRVLGTIERRGYAIEALDMPPSQNGSWTLSVTARPRADERPNEVLVRQIERLIDVRAARVETSIEEPVS